MHRNCLHRHLPMLSYRVRMGQNHQGRNMHKRTGILPIYLIAKRHHRRCDARTAFAFSVEATNIVVTEDWPNSYIYDWKRVSLHLRISS